MAGGNIIVKLLGHATRNKSHKVKTAGSSLVNNQLIMFDATTRDVLIPGANTIGCRFAGVCAGVYDATEYADFDIARFIEVTEHTPGVVMPGDPVYLYDDKSVEGSGYVLVGYCRATALNGVAGHLLVDTAGVVDIPAGSGIPVFALVGTVAFTDTVAKTLGVLPAGARVIDVTTIVTTTFNADGTDLINVGYTTDADHWVDDLDGSSAGLIRSGAGSTVPVAGLGVQATSQTVLGIYATSDATNLTQGSVTVIISYVLA